MTTGRLEGSVEFAACSIVDKFEWEQTDKET